MVEIDLSEYLDEFIDDTSDLLESLKINLNKLKDNISDQNILNEIFRVAHSIKGMSASMEFNQMEALTHSLEDLMYSVREGEVSITKSDIQTFLDGQKILTEMLESISDTGGEDEFNKKLYDEVLAKLKGDKQDDEIEDEQEVKTEDIGTKRIETLLKDGKKLIKGKVVFDDNSAFKSVRALIILKKIEELSELLYSNPAKEKLSDQNYNFSQNEIKVVIDSDLEKEFLKNEIENVSEVLFSVFSDVKSIDDIKDFETNLEAEIANEEEEIKKYPELIQKLSEIEATIIGIEENSYEPESLEYMMSRLRDIHKVVSTIDSNISYPIEAIIEILFIQSEKKLGMKNEVIDLIISLSTIYNDLFEDITIRNDHEFFSQLNVYNELIKDIKIEFDAKKDKRIGEILKENLHLEDNEIEDIAKAQKEIYPDKKFGEVAVLTKKVKPKDVVTSLKTQKKKEVPTEKIEPESKTTQMEDSSKSHHENIRIPSAKADKLLDILEEIMIVQYQVEKKASDLMGNDNQLASGLGRMFRLTKQVQNLSISFRMVTLKVLFQKVKVTVRDTCKKLDKNIKIEITGEDTEVDRIVSEKILDPMLHLIKNSISHGIENKEKRIELGKDEKGHVDILAYSRRGYVYIEINDDGQGINPEIIYKKALEKGIADNNTKYSDDDKINFIFSPGFSTMEKVDKISGRGVGMDVVKTELSKINGKINVDTEIGKGTKFTIRIPKNMTALNGTVIEVKKTNYIIPTVYVKEVLKPEDTQWIQMQDKTKMLKVRDELIPILSDVKLFEKILNKKESIIIILEVEGKYKAIPVENVKERREVVVKPLTDDFKEARHIYGATILGDGKAALILDIENIFKFFEMYST